MSDAAPLQTNFLKTIEQALGHGRLLALEIATALNISKGEAYKKIRGESAFTLAQINELCHRFGVQFSITGDAQAESSIVNFKSFQQNNATVADYIERLSKFLQTIASRPGSKLTCATDDIPVFHLFKYAELTAFKLHFWQLRASPGSPFIFKMDNWDEALLQKTQLLHQQYSSIPTREIWTKSSLLNTLEQIRFAQQSGIIAQKETGRTICKQLRMALADIEMQAITHSKSASQKISFDWYFYDIIGSITYLAEMDENLMAFVRFNTFNTLQAYNQPLCYEIKDWLEKLIADSTGFSGQGSMQRNRYLAEAYHQCDELEKSFGM